MRPTELMLRVERELRSLLSEMENGLAESNPALATAIREEVLRQQKEEAAARVGA